MKEIKNFGVGFDETVLENEVKLYSFYKPNSPIYFRAFFYAGSQFDGDKPGLAHFCEHVMVSGTEKYPTKNLLNEKIQEIGGAKNAFTYFENLWLTMDLSDKTDLPEMFDLVDQMLNHSLYTQESVDIERGAILAEQGMNMSNPRTYIYNLMTSLLFQGTVLENNILGTEESVKKISREDLIDYRDKYLINGQVAYFISGDFDREIVVDLLNKINKSRQPIKIPAKQLPVIDIKKELIKDVPKAEQTYVNLGMRITPVLDKSEILSAQIFSGILGQGNTSILHKTLRDKKGLVYGVYAAINNTFDYSYLEINTSCKAKDTTKVIKTIKEEVQNIIRDGINEKELERVKKNILRNIKFQSETAGFWVKMSMMIELTNMDKPFLLDEYLELMNVITVDNINLFIKKYLTDRELLLAGIGDFNPSLSG